MHTINVKVFTDEDREYFNVTFALVSQNPNFVCNYLENLRIEPEDESKQQLLSLIIKYCKKIKFLRLYDFDNQEEYFFAQIPTNVDDLYSLKNEGMTAYLLFKDIERVK
uniref:Uncharacterized protein n=1 Tax=Rhizophagus irregularis (strain DAOM 181602 / DAOM 197198 / MUCL 43194) TaxID=747089 RepID=U9THB4_RHIID